MGPELSYASNQRRCRVGWRRRHLSHFFYHLCVRNDPCFGKEGDKGDRGCDIFHWNSVYLMATWIMKERQDVRFRGERVLGLANIAVCLRGKCDTKEIADCRFHLPSLPSFDLDLPYLSLFPPLPPYPSNGDFQFCGTCLNVVKAASPISDNLLFPRSFGRGGD